MWGRMVFAHSFIHYYIVWFVVHVNNVLLHDEMLTTILLHYYHYII